MRELKFAYHSIIVLGLIILAGCGGGGGGSGSGSNNSATFILSQNTVRFDGIEGGYSPSPATVTGTVNGATGNVYIKVELTNRGVVASADVDISGNTGTLTLYPGNPTQLRAGTHEDTVTVKVCNNSSCSSQISGSPKTIKVIYVVTYDANIADRDGDGVVDINDKFPEDPSESADFDNDGIGDNADTDDDNDGIADTDDAFPLDASESADTDGDGIGNNADDNDDNDQFADSEDPYPLDATAPAKLYSANPSVLIAGNSTSLVISGAQFSDKDSFYLDGQPVSATQLSDGAVEINVPAINTGKINLSVKYPDTNYQSSLTLDVVESTNFAYTSLAIGGMKMKGYYDARTKSLYTYTLDQSTVTRYRFEDNNWNISTIAVADLMNISMNSGRDMMVAITRNGVREIDLDSFSLGQNHDIDPGWNSLFTNGEFDFANRLVLVTNFYGSGATQFLTYDMESESPDYGTTKSFDSLYQSAIAISRDGTKVLLGENGLSPVQSLVEFRPLTEDVVRLVPTAQFASGDMDTHGNLILVNELSLYNASYSLVGELSTNSWITATAMSSDGDFVIGVDSDKWIYWFYTGGLSGQLVTSSYSAVLPPDVGFVRELVLSDDGLTVFVLGENKTLILPVWQIKENAIGSSQICPSAGCF